MVRLEKSEALGRIIRQDELSQLGVSTWTKIKEAINEGRIGEALELVDYLNVEGKRLHDLFCDTIWACETYIADNLGEEALYQALRQMVEQPSYKGMSELSIKDYVLLRAESERAQRSGPGEMGDITVTEEEGGFRVQGKRVERVVARTDWRYDESVRRLHRTLERLGVTKMLEEAGVQDGDTVYIGDTELEWS